VKPRFNASEYLQDTHYYNDGGGPTYSISFPSYRAWNRKEVKKY